MNIYLLTILAVSASIAIMAGTALFLLYNLNRKLYRELDKRLETNKAFEESRKVISNYSRQMEQFSQAATSVLSIRDEKIIGRKISKVIVEHSDYQRVLISLFKDEFPYREIIGYAGVPEEIIKKISKIELPASWYDQVFEQGIRFGQLSHYIPHTMKNILNQDATVFGTVETPEESDRWHPDDNLFVRMNDENGNFIGVISVDDSKSGSKPNDDIVRPLEIFSSLISQIIVLKREFEKRRELEEQLRQAQKMEAIGNLTGGIAHDFNNILGVIIGNSEIAMLDLPQESEPYQSFEEIKTAAIRARDIVRQLLSFSRKSVRVCKPMLLQTVLQESLTFMRSTIPSSIEIEREFLEEKTVIDGDPTGIYQIMVNLCTNAAQAMEDGPGTLTITLDTIDAFLAGVDKKQFPESGKFARIMVSDTGKGIPEEHLHQIFDPYFTTKDIGKGTGIGLSVVHGIVKGHKGVISVESRQGEGTVFTLLLPMASNLSEEEGTGEETATVQGEGRILLVDDELSLLEINRKMLERCGYLVDSFTNPVDSLVAFMKNPDNYNLVITDFTMPYMTGDLLAKEIWSINPEMPVILSTGFEDKINEQQALDLGIRHYLRKPLSMQKLAEMVTCTLRKN